MAPQQLAGTTKTCAPLAASNSTDLRLSVSNIAVPTQPAMRATLALVPAPADLGNALGHIEPAGIARTMPRSGGESRRSRLRTRRSRAAKTPNVKRVE